ncbi:MAG: chemotaxis protein CheX [Gammaproteobacteria bacterium]|nr:chemotaxis protein CheX [Gammaproteobacteria bacterium]
MDEADLQVFIDGTVHYFSQSSNQPAVVGTPYLVDDNKAITNEYTGIIGVSGRRKGSVFFTAPKKLLKELLVQLGESDDSHEYMCDLVGEVANTISGNARKEFGKEFMISVPVVIVGDLERIANPEHLRSFVIPLRWNEIDAFLVICLE